MIQHENVQNVMTFIVSSEYADDDKDYYTLHKDYLNEKKISIASMSDREIAIGIANVLMIDDVHVTVNREVTDAGYFRYHVTIRSVSDVIVEDRLRAYIRNMSYMYEKIGYSYVGNRFKI